MAKIESEAAAHRQPKNARTKKEPEKMLTVAYAAQEQANGRVEVAFFPFIQMQGNVWVIWSPAVNQGN